MKGNGFSHLKEFLTSRNVDYDEIDGMNISMFLHEIIMPLKNYIEHDEFRFPS